MRRDFIANAAHELRTPLTNLQGYLEALRDGVITADRATYESLLGRGRAARPAVALARCAGRGRRGDEPADARRARPRRRRSAPRSSSPSRRSTGPASRVVVDVPEHLPARANPDHARPGARQPPVQRRALHAGRRDGHGPRRAPRRPTSWSRSRTPARASRPRTSTASSSASTGSRSRATGRAAAPGIGLAIVKQLVEAGGGRVGAESGDGHDALLVQPAGARRQGMAMQTIPVRIPASPNHWIGSQPLAEERDRDDDRDRRTERRRQADHPGRRGLEPDREGDEPEDVEDCRRARSRRRSGSSDHAGPPTGRWPIAARRPTARTTTAAIPIDGVDDRGRSCRSGPRTSSRARCRW